MVSPPSTSGRRSPTVFETKPYNTDGRQQKREKPSRSSPQVLAYEWIRYDTLSLKRKMEPITTSLLCRFCAPNGKRCRKDRAQRNKCERSWQWLSHLDELIYWIIDEYSILCASNNNNYIADGVLFLVKGEKMHGKDNLW